MLYVDIQKKLKEFDLQIQFEHKKGCLGILGASGSGKSMILKSIAGIVQPDQGKIEGNQIFYDSEHKINLKPQKRNVGYLFQNYALFPNMTILRNIEIGMKEKDEDTLNALLDKFGLESLKNQYPTKISGGQQQRVALARMLASDPSVLLFDEPTSALDAYLKEKVRIELKKLMKEFDGVSILVSHDRDEIYQLCDSILLLDRGKILQYGKTKDVFENPISLQAAKLTGCKNISKIERIDRTHVKALDWNCTLEVKEMQEDISYIGIRAHDFTSCQKGEVNCMHVNVKEIIELPFEWEILLDNGLWWKVHKEIHEHDSNFLQVEYLSVSKDSILLLK